MQIPMQTQLIQQAGAHEGQYAAMASLVATDQKPAPKGSARLSKIRRTRQSRNPQLSVARRNERERNRVRQVNDGFARLRERLPSEYLQAAGEAAPESGCDTPDLGGQQSQQRSSAGSVAGANKARKFSKVETLRAAIQHIRMLERLMRAAEPEFQSVRIAGASNPEASNSMLGLDELDAAPLSIGQPASCNSSASATQQFQQQAFQPATSEQFVKLEPTQTVHALQQQQQQQQQHLYQHQQAHTNQLAQQPLAHTQLWIQQHQSSFIEQQQQQQYEEAHEQQQQQWCSQAIFLQHQHQQLSPVSTGSPASLQQHGGQQPIVWYSSAAPESSPSPQSQLGQAPQSQPSLRQEPAPHHHHHHHELSNFRQQHQISLYSQ